MNREEKRLTIIAYLNYLNTNNPDMQPWTQRWLENFNRAKTQEEETKVMQDFGEEINYMLLSINAAAQPFMEYVQRTVLHINQVFEEHRPEIIRILKEKRLYR